jgi:hypothetical protein
MEEALTGTAEVSEGEEISPRKFFPESRWEVIESEVECLTGYSPEDEVLMWDPCPREKATYAGNFDTHKWEPKSEIENLPDGWEYFKLGDYVDAPEMDYPMNQHTHEEITLEEFAGSAFDAAFDTENE